MAIKSNIAIETERSYAQTIIGLLAAVAYMFLPETAFAQDGGIGTAIQKFGTNVGPLPVLLQDFFYIAGIALVAKGLLNGKRLSEDPRAQGGVLGVAGPLAVGGILLVLPTAWEVAYNSIIGDTGGNIDETLQRLKTDAPEDQTIGAAVDNFGTNVFGGGNGGLYYLVQYICYITGTILLGSALNGAYRLSSGAQGAPKISGVAWRLGGGSLLLSLPAAASMIRSSFFDDPSIKHNFRMSIFDRVDGEGLDAALTQLVANVRDPVIDITFAVTFLCGLILIGQALYAMSGIGFEQQRITPQQIVLRLIFGGLLISSRSIYEAVTISIFAYSPEAETRVLAYTNDIVDGTRRQMVTNVFNAILAWVQIVGVIAFFRGWFTLKASLDGGNVAKSAGLTQVIAGALLINIPTTVQWIGNTMGIPVFS